VMTLTSRLHVLYWTGELTSALVKKHEDPAVSVSAETLSLLCRRYLLLSLSKMLSFPAQNWQKARPSRKNSDTSGVASLIAPRLYLTDYSTARNSEKLEDLGITHVISITECRPDLPRVIPQTQRLHLQLSDIPEENILEHLDATTAFITAALKENETNKVMVSDPFRSSLT
jgi:hypothetical protein